MTVSFEMMVLLTVPAASVLLVLCVWWLIRQQAKRQQLLWSQLEQQKVQMDATANEISELRSGLISIGQRLLKSEQQLAQLQHDLRQLSAEQQAILEQQQKLDMFDPESKLYSRAMKMVQLGAPLEEVMRECELPRAEAELLYNLHRSS